MDYPISYSGYPSGRFCRFLGYLHFFAGSGLYLPSFSSCYFIRIMFTLFSRLRLLFHYRYCLRFSHLPMPFGEYLPCIFCHTEHEISSSYSPWLIEQALPEFRTLTLFLAHWAFIHSYLLHKARTMQGVPHASFAVLHSSVLLPLPTPSFR